MKRGLALALVATACAPVIRTARLTDEEPPSDRELAAKELYEHKKCGRSASLLFPGVGQICEGQTGAGATMAVLGATELGTAIGVATRHDISYPGVLYPLAAAQDVYLFSVMDALRTEVLGRQLRYAPQDSTEELLDAPFNPRALARPTVWGGLLGFLAGDLGVTAALTALEGQRLSFPGWGGRPVLFGTTFNTAPGYATAALTSGLLFEHVALAEELAFRGMIGSGLARRYGETAGWLGGAAIFGLMHAFNALFLPDEQRLPYLAVAVPFITLLGSYLGWLYRHSGYSLVPSTALHFWYDFMDVMVSVVLSPKSSPLSGRLW